MGNVLTVGFPLRTSKPEERRMSPKRLRLQHTTETFCYIRLLIFYKISEKKNEMKIRTPRTQKQR